MRTKNLQIRNVNIYKIEICFFVGLLMALLCCFSNLINETSNLSSKIFRLHILANSDSETDQNLKIKLKNALLQNFNFDECNGNVELAKKKIQNRLNEIETYSKNFVKQQGFDYDVKACIEKSYFDTRTYSESKFALPAGFYNALKIKIGNATGKNWWCVFVPSMCVPAASNAKQKINKVLNSKQQNLIEKGSKTEIRFATIEAFEKIKNLFHKTN